MFSYAQAAKGLAPSTQTNSTIASSASSDNGSKEVPTESSHTQIKSKQSSPQQDTDQINKTSASTDTEVNGLGHHGDETSAKSTPQDAHTGSKVVDGTEAVSASLSKSGINSPDPEDQSTNDEQPVHSPLSDRSAPPGDLEKAKEIDDDWEKVSVPSVAAEKELKAAPLPPVNIWLQRKEAQQAKAKEQGGARNGQAPPRQKSQVAASIDEGRRQSSNREAIDTEKETSFAPRRVNSGGRTAYDRKEQSSSQVSPRSLSKQSEKISTTSPPSTADAESWPTPDITPTEDRRRSSVLDKADKVDAKSNTQKKAWIQMPFVPTAKFETQLPPAAAARRGGRPSNRGRENAGRGGISAQTPHGAEKSEPGLMGPPPIPNKFGENERGRKQDSSRNNRASSVPTQSHRAASKDSNTSSFVKVPITASSETSDNNVATSTTQTKTDTRVTDENVAIGQSSRSSSHNPSRQQSGTRKVATELRDATHPSSHNARPSFDGNAHTTNHVDRHKGFSRDGSRPYTEYADRNVAHNREWSQGRIDVGREKSESWRVSRDSRPERGRGGYRGRGNHNGYNPHGQGHAYTSPLMQNGFESKSISNQDGRSRQTSQPYVHAQSTSSRGGNARSQSIPLAMMQQGYYNPAQGYSQALSPTDMNYANYTQQTQGSIMNSMPYNEHLSSYALISMVVAQLEYYFSIDNLCKDMFLRKHMDSQGFVFLSVIAGFKRIQALTEGAMSREHLKNICQQVPNIELVTGDDGEDRLRSRENWQDFILPIQDRFPAAQNDGPKVHAQNQPTPLVVPSGYASPNGHIRSPSAHLNGFAEPFVQPLSPGGFSSMQPLNGVSEHGTGRPDAQTYDHARRTSGTSPFSKVQSPPAYESRGSPSHLTNGHHRSMSSNIVREDVFPDERISELKVVVRDPAYEAIPSQENGISSPDVPGLRGGASSPSQLEPFRTIHFGHASTPPVPLDMEQPSYFTRDGDLAKIPVGPGFVHEDYLALHDTAIQQRTEKHLDGALSVLYSFWSSFLINNFNVLMYKEFVDLALGDVHSGSDNGKIRLVSYYDNLLASKIPMSERIASDIVTMAREETGDRRPTYQRLRSAWRNGATNLKTRKRLGDILTDEEKTEFDRV